jgi:hypothetical protein
VDATNWRAELAIRFVALNACHYAMPDRTGEVAAALNQIARDAKLSSAEPDAAPDRDGK